MLTIFFLIVAAIATCFMFVMFEDGIEYFIHEVRYDYLAAVCALVAFYLFGFGWYYFAKSISLWEVINHGIGAITYM